MFVLLAWILISTVLTLALLRAAAKPRPAANLPVFPKASSARTASGTVRWFCTRRAEPKPNPVVEDPATLQAP